MEAALCHTVSVWVQSCEIRVFVQASRDLACFLQLDHVNVYLGQDYKSKYKAPTDYCMVLKVGGHDLPLPSSGEKL